MPGAGSDEPPSNGIFEVIQRPDQGRPQDTAVCSATDLDELLFAEGLAEKQNTGVQRRIKPHVIRVA